MAAPAGRGPVPRAVDSGRSHAVTQSSIEMSKRELLKRGLDALGLTWLTWRRLPPGLYIINYHRVGDAHACAFDRDVFSCTLDDFREHLTLIAGRFEVIGLEQLRRSIAAGAGAGDRRLALITFDDGYIDNYQLAFPELRALGLTACFFVPTAFVGGARIPWWDEIAWIVRNATVARLRLPDDPGEVPLDDDREPAIRRVLAHVKRSRDLAGQIDRLREACRPESPAWPPSGRLFMSWDELNEMRRAGMDIGSHTHSHPILSQLSADEQEDELATSRGILESELGEPVDAIAYPVGGPEQFTEETCRIADATGYRLGFSFIRERSAWPVSHPLSIPRFAADDPDLRATLCYPWYRS